MQHRDPVPLELAEAYRRSGLTLDQLFLRCFALGANLRTAQLAAAVDGGSPLTGNDAAVVAAALEEQLSAADGSGPAVGAD